MNLIPHSKPYISPKDIASVLEVLNSRFIGRCEKTKELEDKISKATNARNVVCVGSGRSAIASACQILRLKKVFVPTYSCDDLIDAPLWAGTAPIPYDIDQEVTEAAIVVHGPIKVHVPRGTKVIHDFANVFPKNFDLVDDIAIFSFGPLKPITGGHGGAIAYNFPLNRDKLSNLSPTSDINSALTLSQLKREKPVKRYLTVESFEDCQNDFFKQGILVRHETGGLVHRMLKLKDKDFPNAVKRWNTIVSVPNYPDLTLEERHRIDHACRRYSV